MNELKYVIKKDGLTKEAWDDQKIVNAVRKSATRVLVAFTDEQNRQLVEGVRTACAMAHPNGIISVAEVHNAVETVLDTINSSVAKSYRSYRDGKEDRIKLMADVEDEITAVRFLGDKENSNKDAAQNSTKRSLYADALTKKLYMMNVLSAEERAATKTGFIYPHDMNMRQDAMNCCLFDIQNVLTGGFEMGNIFYNEPKSLDVAFDVIGDIVLAAASQQYGGFTIPEVDKILAPYAEKTFRKSYDLFLRLTDDPEIAEEEALNQVEHEFKQGWQGWEIKFNTVASSRGDYPFITVTLGLGTDRFSRMCSLIAAKVHREGQGAPGHKKPVLFPKYVFLFDENLHGIDGVNNDIFEEFLETSRKTMYPDWLSLTGEGYVPSMYKKYGKVISPMGCRAFLSPWYKIGKLLEDGSRDHFDPAEDQEDEPVFVGRFNMGAVSLNLPLIYLDAKAQGKDFLTSLDYYLEMIRQLHIKTKNYFFETKASTNPIAFTQGGFFGGNLGYNQKLKESFELMDSCTYSFGITALNELQQAYNGKSIADDGQFALEVLQHINRKVEEFKHEDHMLYAIYGTPAESLCGKQIERLRTYTRDHSSQLKNAGYEIVDGNKIPGVCDREYVSNSFHCHVTEDITGPKKQDLEYRFWNLCNGGKIQYVRYPVSYNKEAITSTVLRAMKMGFYEGVNLALNYCDDCGHEEIDMADTCPCCGSKNITKIDRMNGYLSYSRVKGDTRLNAAKMAEIADRKSM